MTFSSKLGSAQLGSFELASVGQADTNNASSAISFSQSATVIITGNDYAVNTLSFNQTIRVFSPNYRANNSIIISSAVNISSTISKSASDTLTFYLVADEEKKILTTNTITFTDLASASKSLGAYNSLSFSQTLINQYNPHKEIVHPNLVFFQALNISIAPKLPTDTITFTGNAVGNIVKNKSLSHFFVINQDVSSGKREYSSNSISFSDDVSTISSKSRQLSDILSFTDSNSVNIVVNFAIIDTLIFSNDNHQLNGIQVPNLQATIPKPNVTLQTTDLAIILPRPVYNDSEEETDELVKMRAINGTLYTYVRTNINRVLKYNIEIDRTKQYELRNFVDNYITDKMQLTNWKGEIWVGYITNNPFEFVTILRKNNCGERYKVTLEFNGTMIHG